ncbi:hypothetical protein [Streptomyces sp. NRRL S-1448]|uniref:hypothetical protein n=1 Tax=Streptomyces sp. NRRL S-1448 TaxID=1463883 RepID=UPI0004BEEC86|nr:hypothetical protein [Streptomyces sp. NRRL S-1448]
MNAADPPAPPTSAEDALAIVRSRCAAPKLPDGTPAALRVHEFDIGYLVYPVFPRPDTASGRSRLGPLGGSKVVVAKDSGETVWVPNLPTASAVALYRSRRGLTS